MERITTRIGRLGGLAVGLGIGAALAAIPGTAAADTTDMDSVAAALFGGANSNDPAVIPYSADPLNIFSPVYTIKPIGPEVPGTPEVGTPYGSDGTIYTQQDFINSLPTQEFGVYSLGLVQDGTFTGHVEYTPTTLQDNGLSGIVSELDQMLGGSGGYTETVYSTAAGSGGVPSGPAVLDVTEFGAGYGFALEGTTDAENTTEGFFLLTPFGDWNMTPMIDLFDPTAVG